MLPTLLDIRSRNLCAAALSLLVTLMALPSDAHARFDSPQVDGMPMDGCLGFATDCEQTAAEYFCRQNGYAAVGDWATENSPSNTKTLQTKEICNISQWICNRFSFIECTQSLMPDAQPPAPPSPPASSSPSRPTPTAAPPSPPASSSPSPSPASAAPEFDQSLMDDPDHVARPVGVGARTHPDRILLLLHGINSDSSTWDKLVGKLGFSDNAYCPTLTPNTSEVGHAQMTDGVYCYRVTFGSHDFGRIGLEGLRDPLVACNAPAGCNGDFSTFDELGVEIYLKLFDIGIRHGQDTEIVLIGHSRGGLAARAFLQNYPVQTTLYKVVGLITLGTPHRGSEIGRIYNYLAADPAPPPGSNKIPGCMTDVAPPPGDLPKNCAVGGTRSTTSDDCRRDWIVAETLLRSFPLPGIDVRTPGVCYLADNSTQIDDLNKNAASLPEIDYRIASWSGNPLGFVLDWPVISWTVIDDPAYPLQSLKPHISDPARMAILEGNTLETFLGDGIVSEDSQLFENQWPAHVKTTLYRHQAPGVIHTEETSQVDHISKIIADAYHAVGWR